MEASWSLGYIREDDFNRRLILSLISIDHRASVADQVRTARSGMQGMMSSSRGRLTNVDWLLTA
jgi:hypothetical protein